MSDLSVQQALIYAMITTSASDNAMTDAELARIGWIVKVLPAFDGFNEDDLIAEAQACGRVASGPDGLNTVLGLIAEALPEHMRETAFVLAAEIAASDLKSSPEERRFLQLLAVRLKLEPLTVAALSRAAVVRHRRT
ncbi:MAG: tellurite resistance TerB family protein [Hyphomicrobiaceae bacterium]